MTRSCYGSLVLKKQYLRILWLWKGENSGIENSAKRLKTEASNTDVKKPLAPANHFEGVTTSDQLATFCEGFVPANTEANTSGPSGISRHGLTGESLKIQTIQCRVTFCLVETLLRWISGFLCTWLRRESKTTGDIQLPPWTCFFVDWTQKHRCTLKIWAHFCCSTESCVVSHLCIKPHILSDNGCQISTRSANIQWATYDLPTLSSHLVCPFFKTATTAQ